MVPSLTLIGIVALCGAAGGVARFWVSGMIARRIGERFPWGTFVVNVTGAAAIGFAAVLLGVGGPGSNAAAWIGLATGFLGSYTTVSSFALQTLALARDGEHRRALFNVVLSTVACLAAAAGGMLAARHLLGG
jgi:CrcB protein